MMFWGVSYSMGGDGPLLIYIYICSQIGSFPQVGVNFSKRLNHHPGILSMFHSFHYFCPDAPLQVFAFFSWQFEKSSNFLASLFQCAPSIFSDSHCSLSTFFLPRQLSTVLISHIDANVVGCKISFHGIKNDPSHLISPFQRQIPRLSDPSSCTWTQQSLKAPSDFEDSGAL